MKEAQLELTAVLLNINRNHNRELMEACRDLKDYAEYVDRVRKYAKEGSLPEAVDRAITESRSVSGNMLWMNKEQRANIRIHGYQVCIRILQ